MLLRIQRPSRWSRTATGTLTDHHGRPGVAAQALSGAGWTSFVHRLNTECDGKLGAPQRAWAVFI
jgi:hypothetical protein